LSSIDRRALLAGTSAALAAVSGCGAPSSLPGSSEVASGPHWVKTYLGDRRESHRVAVTVANGNGDVLFEKSYRLSDDNEADEGATFPASTDPETVVVTVDGTRFERDWPGFEEPELHCDGPNEAGVEIHVENARDGTPSVRFEADCQSVSGA